MGRQHRVRRKVGDKLAVAGQEVERVGVEEEWLIHGAQQASQQDGRTLLRADAGANGYGVEFLKALRQHGDAIAVRIEVKHGFREGRLERRLAPLRQVDGQLAHAAVHAGGSGQECGAHAALTAGDEQRVAEVALVREAAAGAEHGLYILVGDHEVSRRRFLHNGGVKADGEGLPAAHVDLVFGQQHGQLGELEGERHFGADDAVGVVAQVVLAEESGGHIDGYDGGVGLVDVANYGRIAACEGAVEAGAK